MTSDKKYCYPLMITDYSSHFLISCDAFTSTAIEFTFESFERTFMEYGVPKAIRADNGKSVNHVFGIKCKVCLRYGPCYACLGTKTSYNQEKI